MVLVIHSDAGYANEKKARSCTGGHFFLSNNNPDPPNNGAILTNVTIIKNVMSSAAEAEIGALYVNAKEAICWLPYPQNYITGITSYGTGNATHTGNVIFKRYITDTSAAKAGSPYPQTYFTGIAPKIRRTIPVM